MYLGDTQKDSNSPDGPSHYLKYHLQPKTKDAGLEREASY